MSLLKIALLQMVACGNDQSANLSKGEEFCRRAKQQGADIALFPEMWNIGYTPYAENVWKLDYDPIDITPEEARLRNEWQDRAIAIDDPFVVHFARLAKELKMAIAITYLEKWEGAPRNTVSLIDSSGTIRMTYAKVHTCDFSLEASCTPGDGFHVCTLDTSAGQVEIGAMICYDREFPESARILMLKGAEIILTPNACTIEPHRIAQFKTRAYENMVGVAMTNYAAPQCNGHSIAFDAVAFDNGGNSRDNLIVEGGEEEGIYIAEFDIDAIREYRQREIWGNSYRKPSHYEFLTSPDVRPPFIRKDARR